MTAYRGLFLPTLLGMAVILPPASAQTLTTQIPTADASEIAIAKPPSGIVGEELEKSKWKHAEDPPSGSSVEITHTTKQGGENTEKAGQREPEPLNSSQKPRRLIPPDNPHKWKPSLEAREQRPKPQGFMSLMPRALPDEVPTGQTGQTENPSDRVSTQTQGKPPETPPPALPQLMGNADSASTQTQGKSGETPAPALPQLMGNADSVFTQTQGKSGETPAPALPQLMGNAESAPTPPLPPSSSLAQAPGGVRILNPQPGTTRDARVSLVVQYPDGQTVVVKVNGDTIEANTPTQIQRDGGTTTQTWYNIQLKPGENVITVQAGTNPPAEVRLTLDSGAAKLEFTPAGDPRVRADGRSTVNLEGRVTDAKGEPLRGETTVTLTSSSGQFVGADQDEDEPGFQVTARDGQFTAQLQSSLSAGQVRVRAAIANPNYRLPLPDENPPLTRNDEDLKQEIEVFTQVEFIPNLRPSLVSGVANLRIGPRGTNFWGSMRDFLNPDDIDTGTEFDFDSALFATGPVGEWLFTGALNTSRALNQTCDGNNQIFGGIQFCDRQYPVYGDSSTVDYLTPSKDSFYVRFERAARTPGAEPDYGMWGDYYTQEFARASQLFTANQRSLHGFKANYSFGNLQLTALYSPDAQGFQRDTIVPDGTSGLYFLSRRLLIPGSENIFIETEELNRPGTVLERRQLSRGADYEVDYDRGTLRFKNPLLATSFDLFDTGTAGTGATLVRRIVATYQYEGGPDTYVVAGRAQYNFNQSLNRPAFAGLTYWREDMGMRDFDLLGLDVLLPLGDRGQFVGEYARSNNDFAFRGNRSGQALRLELNAAIADWLGGRVYYRNVDQNFLNNATASFNPGQTRYGASLTAQIARSTNFDIQYDFESNYGFSTALRTGFDLFEPGVEARTDGRVDNSLRTISAGVRQRIGRATVSLNYVNRSREDRRGDLDGDASQIVAKLGVPLTSDDKLTFRAQHEQNLGDSDALYPTRTTVGLDWQAYPGVTLRLAHQFFDGGLLTDNSITSLDTVVEREIFKDTYLTSRYSVLSGFNSMTGQGALGVRSRIRIAPGLRLLLGYERVQNDIFSRTGAGRRFAQPFAVSQTAASLGLGAGDSYSIGLEYTDNPDFKASGRFEYSGGSFRGRNMVIDLGLAGKVSRSITALARYYQANSSNQLLEGLDDTINFRLGLAYRDPNDDKFNALLTYQFRRNPAQLFDEILEGVSTDSTDHLLAMEAIYAPNWRWEFYGKYALRLSDLNLSRNFSNNTATSLAQLRATYRLGYRTDLAGEVRWIGQDEYSEWGWAAEFGYYLTPDLRLGLGYSFGSVDDRDFSGFRSSGGPYFQITFKVNELFGGFGRQRVVPRQQEENEVQPRITNLPASSVNGMIPVTHTAGESEIIAALYPFSHSLELYEKDTGAFGRSAIAPTSNLVAAPKFLETEPVDFSSHH